MHGVIGPKANFLRNYPGPKGPHLSHLTMTTMKGSYEEKDQESIHPRCVNRRQVHAKVNTAKAPKK